MDVRGSNPRAGSENVVLCEGENRFSVYAHTSECRKSGAQNFPNGDEKNSRENLSYFAFVLVAVLANTKAFNGGSFSRVSRL